MENATETLNRRIGFGRTALVAVAVITLADLVLRLLNVELGFTFVACLPKLMVAAHGGNVIGIAAAVLYPCLFLVLFILSSRLRGCHLTGLILLVPDAAIVLYMVIKGSFAGGFSGIAGTLLFHAWAISSMIAGAVAEPALKKAEQLKQ